MTSIKAKQAVHDLLLEISNHLYTAEMILEDIKTTPENRAEMLELYNQVANANGVLKTVLDQDWWG